MQFHGTGNAPAIFLRNGGIVAFCGVDVFVSENVGYNVNITRFVIQSRAVRTAKFVRRDFLQRRYRFAVFFYQKLTERTLIRLYCMERNRAFSFSGIFGSFFFAAIYSFKANATSSEK